MADSGGTLASLATGLARLVQPLTERLQGEDLRVLLAELGLTFPDAIDADAALTNASQAAVQRLSQRAELHQGAL